MTAPITTVPTPSPAAAAGRNGKSSADSSFTFDDLVSIVNPLQHIPIVSTLYRNITGDTIKPLERIMGDTLYGGMLGFASGVADVIFEDVTGKDIGATALAFLEGEDGSENVATADRSSATQAADASQAAAAADASASTNTSLVANGPPRALIPQAQAAATAAAIAPVAMASTAPTTAGNPSAADQPAANGPPRSLQPQQDSQSRSAELALLGALNAQGIDADLSQRALAAYQKSLTTSPIGSTAIH
jgi:hypothetical protein